MPRYEVFCLNSKNSSQESCPLSTARRGRSSVRTVAARKSSSAGLPLARSRRRKLPEAWQEFAYAFQQILFRFHPDRWQHVRT
jgi:hypothetical protein